MITPSQLRSAARFGTGLPKKTLLELADFIEKSRACNQPVRHELDKWEQVAETDTHITNFRGCERCCHTEFKQSKKVKTG